MPISKTKRREVFEKSGGRCAYCGRSVSLKNFTVDHVRPRSAFTNKSLANELENLCTCCRTCNAAKADMTVKEFKTFVNKRNAELLRLESRRRKAIAEAENFSKEIESRKFKYIHYLRTLPLWTE